MTHPVDALDQPIVLGNWYGTSVTYEGKAFVIMGQAVTIKEDTGTIGISIARRRKPTAGAWGGRWSYQDMVFGEWGFKKKTVSYDSEILFPIPPQEVK